MTGFPASPEARPGGERARGPGCKMAAGDGGQSRGWGSAPASLRDLYGSPGSSGAGARNGARAEPSGPGCRRLREGVGRVRGDFRGAAWRAGRAGAAPLGQRARPARRREGGREGASALGRPARCRPAGGGEEDEAPLRSAWSAGSHTMALAEVVVCAVGRVVTLPAVEITAQATALLVLVMLSAAEDNGRGSPLFSGARGPHGGRGNR